MLATCCSPKCTSVSALRTLLLMSVCHCLVVNMLIRVCNFRCEILPPRGCAKSILGSDISIFQPRSLRNSSPSSCHLRTSPIVVVNATLKTPFIMNGTFFMTNALVRNTMWSPTWSKYSSPAERAPPVQLEISVRILWNLVVMNVLGHLGG